MHIELLDQQYFASQYRFMMPSPDLAPHVLFYWMLDLRHSDLQQDEYQELLLANMYSSLVLNLGAPFDIYDREQHCLHVCAGSEVIGYHAAPVSYHHRSNNFLVGIKFKPASLNYLFRIRGTDIYQQVLPAADVLHHIRQLESAVYDAKELPAIKALLEDFLRQHTTLPVDRHSAYVLQSLNGPALQQCGYQLKKLASLLYLSPRTLERYFSDLLGISPKKCLSIIRFREAATQYALHGYKADWEELGYHDFSHFRKEWKKQFI